MADLSKIPLVALSIDTKTLISTLLNPPKCIPTDDALPRDWRGLAHLGDLGGETLPTIASHGDPAGYILTMIQNKNPSCTLKDLIAILSRIDRWDVIDDANALFARDAEKYLERMERCQTSAGEIESNTEKQVLTIDDLYRFRQGLDKQCYDAFLLFSDQDIDFATEVIENLEKKNNLKLCVKDRDLIGGITFEHEAIMQLISERCNRLIVIISPNFLKSPANKFFLNYAQAVGIETRQRKIIPCMFQKCQLPPQLSYTFILDYGKAGLYDFWGRLRDSVSIVASENTPKSVLPTQQSTDCPTEDEVETKQPDIDAKPEINIARPAHSLEMVSKKKCTKSNNRNLMSWPKRNRYKAKDLKKEIIEEPVTECISLSTNLPSLVNMPSLDMLESSTSSTASIPTKRKKNIVGTCVKKVQSLLSKS